MACIIGIIDENDKEKISLEKRQLPLNVDDNKIMIMQLSDTCECCEIFRAENFRKKGKKQWSIEVLSRQFNMLSQDEVLSALTANSKGIFTRLAQVVGCVGCRRSAERLFNQLKETKYPALEPLVIDSTGKMSILKDYSSQPKMLGSLFAEHSAPLNDMLDSIPKLKKSGRCVLHSMEGVRCRPGSQSWLEMWDFMAPSCRETITFISSDQLLETLDNYLRKHRFCHDCKNKVHRAYDILVGNISTENIKDKGYQPALYTGIRQCNKKHIHVSSETDYIMHLITRAEPELQGRRERHAKTLEIAQEEVLTCLGLFLYERFQRVHTKLREEEQTWYILFHVGLDVLRGNFELAVEKKQGFSKFEMLCEELQKQELREKAKKEKKKRKRSKKKNEETKENYVSDDEEEEDQSCHDCESNRSSPLQMNSISSNNRSLSKQSIQKNSLNQEVCKNNSNENYPSKWRGGGGGGEGKLSPEMKSPSTEDRRDRGHSENKETVHPRSSPDSYTDKRHNHTMHSQQNSCSQAYSPEPSSLHLECSDSIDSLASRFSQCSKDCGYYSAHGSGSSRESSDVACGEGFCSHSDDLEHGGHLLDPLDNRREESIGRDYGGSCSKSSSSANTNFPFTLSLEKMLDDSSCEADEIPEAEVKAWHARLGSVKQRRAELRQTLRQRFQQLCYKTTLHTALGNSEVV